MFFVRFLFFTFEICLGFSYGIIAHGCLCGILGLMRTVFSFILAFLDLIGIQSSLAFIRFFINITIGMLRIFLLFRMINI